MNAERYSAVTESTTSPESPDNKHLTPFVTEDRKGAEVCDQPQSRGDLVNALNETELRRIIDTIGFAYLLSDHRCGSGLAFLQPLSRARKPRGAVGGPVSPGAIGGVADATQPAFPLQHAALDCGARTQPEKPDGGQDDRRAERVVAPLTGERRPTGSFAPRGTGFHRRLSGNSAAAFFRPLADRIEDRAGNAQRKCAEYDFAAAGRECDPAWSRAATGRSGRDQRRSYGRAVADRGLQQRRSASR